MVYNEVGVDCLLDPYNRWCGDFWGVANGWNVPYHHLANAFATRTRGPDDILASTTLVFTMFRR